MSRTVTCANCGEKYETDTSKEEMLAEMESFFGVVPESELVEVCDPCYQRINPATHPEIVSRTIADLKGDT